MLQLCTQSGSSSNFNSRFQNQLLQAKKFNYYIDQGMIALLSSKEGNEND
jgi:hypothetical protein